jgi:hypothetical protein
VSVVKGIARSVACISSHCWSEAAQSTIVDPLHVLDVFNVMSVC